MNSENIVSKPIKTSSEDPDNLPSEDNRDLQQDNKDIPPIEEAPDHKKGKSGGGFVSVFFEYLETFCYALVLMILLFMYVFRYVSVDGTSMLNTLKHEDKLIISNLAYTPKTGDIVVVSHSKHAKPLIKRVIATGGQVLVIDYDNWEITVDGVLLEEDYVKRDSNPMWFENRYPDEFEYSEGKYIYRIKEDCVFLMGDNRNSSKDSRYYGLFSEKEILGRVIFRVFPLSEMGKVE